MRVHCLRLRGRRFQPVAGVEAAEWWNVGAFGIAMVTQWTQHVCYICRIKRIIDSSFEHELEASRRSYADYENAHDLHDSHIRHVCRMQTL